MKYFFAPKSISEWSAEELTIINEAIDIAQRPDHPELFLEINKFLHRVTKADYVCIGKTVSEDKKFIQTLVFTHKNEVLENITYCTSGTPCENVLGQNFCYYPAKVQETFPTDLYLVTIGVQCYMGIPLNDREDNSIGIISLMHHKPLENPAISEHLLHILAACIEEKVLTLASNSK